jgi:hypothetical protein
MTTTPTPTPEQLPEPHRGPIQPESRHDQDFVGLVGA